MTIHNPRLLASLAIACATLLSACGDDESTTFVPIVNVRPAYLGAITTLAYDGVTDDLLTGGLGWDGLQSATLPSVSAVPTSMELRRRAIYNNYRALSDMSTAGGYGRLFGPNVTVDGVVSSTAAGAGRIAGTEYIAYVLDGAGKAAATVMVQVPTSFNLAAACIVTATSSGSRGVYGAVSAAGEWGLKRGCAVAYTDKGTGNGAHELGSNTITLINGLTADATAAGNASLFTAALTDADRTAFNTMWPNRYAYKHAHSQANSEKDWGRFTLQAIEFAMYALNEQFGSTVPGTTNKTPIFFPANTLVIAASVSNGGGAAIQAAELDTGGLIDGVVAGEPQVNPRLPAGGINIARGGANFASTAVGRPLYDYVTIANLLQPCAAHAASNAQSPLLTTVPLAGATGRCAALVTAGIISGPDLATQANNALLALRAAGWEPESDLLHASHWGLNATTGVAMAYANAYGRSSVTDRVCGFSYATTSATTGMPAPAAVSPMPTVFGNGNGVPPTNGINLVYDNAAGGPILHNLADGNFAFNGALCLSNLWNTTTAAALAVRAGVAEVLVGGNLRAKPTIMLAGRADALVPVNFAARPYFGLSRSVEGSASRLSYIEVANAQHFDAFLSVAGYDSRFIPLHYYNIQALNMMWSHLRSGAALPPSQLVRATARGGVAGAAPALEVAANLPPISLTPALGDAITYTPANNTVNIPN